MPETSSPVARCDVSYVVNIHSGRNYLARTMRSLEEAASEAHKAGLRTELLLVLDRSPPETVNWTRAYRSDVFNELRVCEVDNGSLGLSRQAGLDLAMGEYIQFCDEDDLISSNTTTVSLEILKRKGNKTIVVPEYLLLFGTMHLLAHYSGSSVIPPLSFIAQHPYVSRLFAHRSISEDLSFRSVPLSSGYAYEDWLFNATAIAKGYSFEPAPDTVMFYRQHSSNLARAMDTSSVRIPPPCPLFEPATFVRICSESIWRMRAGEYPQVDARTICNRFRTNRTILNSLLAANRIEPAIVPVRPDDNRFWSNVQCDFLLGQAYYNACKLVMNEQFSDVLLAHSLDGNKSERQARDAMSFASTEREGNRSLILLDGGPIDPATLQDVPASSLIVDLRSLAPGLSDVQIDIVSLRLIEACAGRARVHLSACDFAFRFGRKFLKLLSSNTFTFHRSPDAEDKALIIEFGEEFNFVAELCDRLDAIVCATRQLIDYDTGRIDREHGKWVLRPPASA